MRYKETGEVHKDFYRTLNGTISYIRNKYGERLLKSTFRRTARYVYRAIKEDLLKGDPEQLVEHWTYFLDREDGQYSIERSENEIRMIVHKCPAVSYLVEKGIEVDPCFCLQTSVCNEVLAEGSPFEITTEVTGEAQCVQTIRRIDS